MIQVIIILVVLTIAIIYSSAGFGGGSLYLALLSQLGYTAIVLRFTALLCNATVTANGTRSYHLSGYLQWKQVLWLLVFSVPLCAWSATFHLEDKTYLILLSCCLLFSAVLMIYQENKGIEDLESKNKIWHYPLSMVIGFVAGLTGIGGGVYLSPMLHLSGWGSSKQIAAASSLFILVNSITGLTVMLIYGNYSPDGFPFILATTALVGSLVGSRLGTSILSQKAVKYITIALIIFSSVRILVRYA